MTALDATIRIRKVLANSGVSDIEDNDSFVLTLDSMDRTQLILDLEEEFGIEIGDDDLPQVGCIARAAEYVVRHAS